MTSRRKMSRRRNRENILRYSFPAQTTKMSTVTEEEKKMFEDTIDAFNSVIITVCRGTVAEHVKAISEYFHFHSLIVERGLLDKYRTYLKENGGEHKLGFQHPLLGTLRDEARKLCACDEKKQKKEDD